MFIVPHLNIELTAQSKPLLWDLELSQTSHKQKPLNSSDNKHQFKISGRSINGEQLECPSFELPPVLLTVRDNRWAERMRNTEESGHPYRV